MNVKGSNPCFIQEVHLNIKHRYFLIEHRWKIFFEEIKQQTFIVILVFDKRNFMPKLIKGNRHYMLIREIIHWEDTAVLSMYTPNRRTHNSIWKHYYSKLHIDPHRLIVGDFSTLLSQNDRSSRQKLEKEMLKITGVYRTVQPNKKEYTFFSVPHEIFSKNGHILRHNKSLNSHKNWHNTLHAIWAPKIKT